MTARPLIVPGCMPSRDTNGRALAAKLRFYAPSTTTPATVYTASDLATPHPFPIVSDSAGRWPAMWAADTSTFDVAWSDLATDGLIKSFVGITPASDAVLASASIASGAADAAMAAQTASEAAEAVVQAISANFGNVNAAITAAQASASAAAASASAAAASAAAAALFDPTHYVTSVAGQGGNVTAAALKTALAITISDITDGSTAKNFATAAAITF